MLSAKQMTNSLAALPLEAQAELGMLQARIQHAIEADLRPKRLYIGRFGHDAGYSIHFHFIPVYDWVEALFWLDERYRVYIGRVVAYRLFAGKAAPGERGRPAGDEAPGVRPGSPLPPACVTPG